MLNPIGALVLVQRLRVSSIFTFCPFLCLWRTVSVFQRMRISVVVRFWLMIGDADRVLWSVFRPFCCEPIDCSFYFFLCSFCGGTHSADVAIWNAFPGTILFGEPNIDETVIDDFNESLIPIPPTLHWITLSVPTSIYSLNDRHLYFETTPDLEILIQPQPIKADALKRDEFVDEDEYERRWH